MTAPRALVFRPATVLEASGEDAFTFLQGQLSNDLNPRASGNVTYGLFLGAKGKVDADAFVLERVEGSFLIVSPHCQSTDLRRRLESFVVADDVKFTDATSRWTGIAVWGAGAEASVELLGAQSPEARRAYASEEILGFRTHRFGADTIEWLFRSDEEGVSNASEKLVASGFSLFTETGAEQERILRGGVAIPAELGPGDLPQEAGVEGIAISFNKGCFIGQEVMARLKSMGRVRRGLIRVRGEGRRPEIPAPLFVGERKVGELRSAAPRESGGFVGRAMVTLTDLPSEFTLGSAVSDAPTVTRDDS
jgi:folate-binding protein YgfZ